MQPMTRIGRILGRKPTPLTADGFPDFIRWNFRNRVKRVLASELSGGGIDVVVEFKNGREMAAQLSTQQDAENFLTQCGMVHDL